MMVSKRSKFVAEQDLADDFREHISEMEIDHGRCPTMSVSDVPAADVHPAGECPASVYDQDLPVIPEIDIDTLAQREKTADLHRRILQ